MFLMWVVSIVLSAVFISINAWDMAVFGIIFFAYTSIMLIKRRIEKPKDKKD